MRKIWTHRKDRDRRKSQQPGSPLIDTSKHNASNEKFGTIVSTEEELNDDRNTIVSTLVSSSQEKSSHIHEKLNSSSATSVIEHGSGTSDPKSGTRMVSALIKQDYDTSTIMNGWLNGILNTLRVSEISEHTLRTVRAELKGSHLYLYRAGGLNVKCFRVATQTSNQEPFSGGKVGTVEQRSALQSNDNTSHIDGSMHNKNHDITYFNTASPHPDLNYDFESRSFLNTSSLESIVHFVLFDDDGQNIPAVTSAIDILPLFPNFDKALELWCNYVELSNTGRLQGARNDALVTDRSLKLLSNVQDNFVGFLLKSDVAPHIIKILELITNQMQGDESESLKIKQFKSDMLSYQQFLIDIVSNSNLDPSINPLRDISSTAFMQTNLIKFVNAVGEVDLKFFTKWNSNIDKSLLLASSLKDTSGLANSFYKKNPLIFNNETHIHYLSRLFIHHLFGEKLASLISLERKARLLEKWIDLGCLLDKTGNMSSWLGISSVILSQPVLRLTKMWSLVSPEYLKLLKNDWSPVLFELDRRHLANDSINSQGTPDESKPLDSGEEISKDSYHIMAPRGLGKIYPKEKVIPYFGDFFINNNSTNINELEPIWRRINYSFNRWNEYLSNLSNYDEIIKYNDDVLKRYDNMGFIFSNESINQVLYLGVNNDDAKHPSYPKSKDESSNSSSQVDTDMELYNNLLKLLEVNCESLNLEQIMKMSLMLEPDLQEAYLQPSINNTVSASPADPGNRNMSCFSDRSANSSESDITDASVTADILSSTSNDQKTSLSDSSCSKVPTFNNNYFKIKLSVYDELVPNSHANNDVSISGPLLSPLSKQTFEVDKDLTFRIDDFLADSESFTSDSLMLNYMGDVEHPNDDDDLSGLGIDVDVILSSEKFNNISISTKHGSPKTLLATQDNVSHNHEYRLLSSDSGSVGQHLKHKYIPKYASINKLVDLLLIDAKYFDELIAVDLVEYRFVFLLNYTSFISTKDLLDMLAHRFINSGNAVISVMKKLAVKKSQSGDKEVEFPNWDLDPTVDLNTLGEVDYELLLKIQINILKVLIVLLNNFYSNFSLNLENKKILIKLLKLFSNEILQWYNSSKIDSSLERSFESLVNYYKKLKKLFIKKTYRPVETLKFDSFLINEFRFTNSLHEVPMNRNLPGHKNVAKIEKFLHKFNRLLAIFYHGIRMEDWMKVFEILEYHFEENTLFYFNLQRANTSENNLTVSNIFKFFESFVDSKQKQLVLKKFPLVFRKLFKIYYKFSAYLLIQLCDLNITLEERLDRMKTLLIMAKLCSVKMGEFGFEGYNKKIPSCIETAVINVIYAPESRVFSTQWIQAAESLNGDSHLRSYDDLDLLLPRSVTRASLQNLESLLPCFGWVIENLLEINKCPSFYKLNINFNKRYLIYKFIKELAIEEVDASDINLNDTREFEFLLKLDESLVNSHSLKEFSSLEKDKIHIFQSVLREEYKILVADNKKKQLSSYTEDKSSDKGPSSDQALVKKTSVPSNRRQSLSYKSNSSSRFKISGIFTKNRPFSLNGLTSNVSERVVDSKELPNPETQIEPRQKPLAVIPLKSKKIFPVYLLPFCFKIDSELSSEDYLFQATDEASMNSWLVNLNYANRHWFYSKTLNLKFSSSNLTFGLPLNLICSREQSLSPKFLNVMFEVIESEGLKDVGIYRISTSLSELNNVKSYIDKTGSLYIAKNYGVHTLTSVVKSYFRELPEALLTDKVIESFIAFKQNARQKVSEDQNENDERSFEIYKEILGFLPPVNYYTLKALTKHLQKICQFSDENKMTASNLATVIGPALTEASSLDSLINNFGVMNSILEYMIVHFCQIFDEI
ncbi:uncharacterized protein PRCAT00003350001 [Priceomyces carsonii]|uniref:uncharacterized protein n=1 Tax=Priceomyces carsonii TaxID=28549 RepID=UPI002EDAEF4F|nr:unnamed protein product [Priceomyces carsonii]